MVRETTNKLLSIKGRRTVDDFQRELGRILWEHCGLTKNDSDLALAKEQIPNLRAEFWDNLTLPGTSKELNQSLEKAGRVADFLEFADLMVADALSREESCGCHFNEAYQTDEHEALRNDAACCYVAAWEFRGRGKAPDLHREPLVFENVDLTQRSYK